MSDQKHAPLPSLEAAGRFVRIARTDKDMRGWQMADCTRADDLGLGTGARVAQMFAAAPELLDALKLFMTCYPAAITSLPDEKRAAILNAIAKAEHREATHG